MEHGSRHRSAPGQGSALLRWAGFFVAGHPPWRSSAIERADRQTPLGRSLVCPLWLRRWSARPCGGLASPARTRACLPDRGMPCHTPALIACSALSAALALCGRVLLVPPALFAGVTCSTLGGFAMHHFPQLLPSRFAATASSWLSPLVRTAIFAASLPHCPPTCGLGLPLEPLSLTARRSRPPHDRLLT